MYLGYAYKCSEGCDLCSCRFDAGNNYYQLLIFTQGIFFKVL